MKITSITVLKPGDIVLKQRDTQKNRNVAFIMEHLSTKEGDLVISGDDMKKFERYQLQRSLQKAGAHVVIQAGAHAATKKPVYIVKRLTNKEWNEYQLGTASGKKNGKK